MTSEEDPLRSLPAHDVNPGVAEHIRRSAHRILNERQRRISHPIAFWCADGYHRVVEPAALIALGLGYLMWTVQDTVSMFH